MLMLPGAAFIVLPVPYCFFFYAFVGHWFGCGCTEGFNANHFSQVFWAVIALFSVVAAVFTSRVIEKRSKKLWYIAGMVLISVVLYYLCSNMVYVR